jgi:predicted SnoaL-like aldol condensation-catalyzing enzyme
MTTTSRIDRTASEEGELLRARKQAAAEFIRLAGTGRVDDAFGKYVAPGFVHHNPHFGHTAEALKSGMAENARQFPHKRIEVLRVIGEGHLVTVHSRVHLTPEDRGYAIAHIYRFDGDRIAELWDIAMEVPTWRSGSMAADCPGTRWTAWQTSWPGSTRPACAPCPACLPTVPT